MFAPSRSHAWTILSAILLFPCFALPGAGQILIVNRDVDHTVTIPLRDMPRVSQSAFAVKREAEPVRRMPLPAGLKPENEPDPVLQSSAIATPALLAPIQGTSFEGLGSGTPGFAVNSAPPDTNGAVGLTQYVQWVNKSLAIFDKTTGAILVGPIAGNTIFGTGTTGCQGNNDGDPVVNYDRLADRWVLSQMSISHPPPILHCVAVSTSSDATGAYNLYAFAYSAIIDYPKMAVWPNGYYATFNMFSGPDPSGAAMCAYQRSAMLLGQTAAQICFQFGAPAHGLIPSDFDGTILPPAKAPNFIVNIDKTIGLFTFSPDFTVPANSSLGGAVIPVAAFTPLCGGGTCVPQPGTATQLDSLADRLMYRAAYRNFGGHESLVVTHSVAANGGGGIRWYEIQNLSTSPVLAQQGTYAPDRQFRWMGSIAMDKFGDMGLGYSLSSTSVPPSIAVTGRIPSDPPGTMQVETIMTAGTGSQTTQSNGTPLSRWGDYSAMQIDPSDDCTFWYTNEYLKANGVFNWATKIGSFKFPACSGGLRFKTVAPCRVADTRNANGPFGGPFLTAGSARGFAIPDGACGIPSTAQAYSVNMTVVPHGTLGFLTVFPCGQAKPLVSTLNSLDGRVKAAAAIVPAGANGAICNFVTNDTDLVIDINGYFVSANDVTALAFFPMTPCRLVDTRNAADPLGGPSLVGGSARSLPLLTSPCNVPATAQSYSLNFTSIPKGSPLGFLTVWPTGQTQPLVSTLNAPTSAVTANAAIVPAGTAGAISVFATDASDLIVDINGYFAPAAPGGLSLFNVAPCRVIDTRNPAGTPPFNGTKDLGVATSGCDAPANAQSFVVNATVVPPASLGFLTLWPQGAAQPLVSTLNAIDGAVTSNMAIIPTTNGQVSVFGANPTHLIVDIFGYFAP